MDRNRTTYVTYEWLTRQGVSIKTINHWVERGQSVVIKIDGKAFVSYDSIPAPTRAKLPSKESIIRMQQKERNERYVQGMYERLYPAMENMYPTCRDIYLKYKLSPEKVLEFSKKHAIFEEILTIKDVCKEEKCRFPLRDVWQAFCKIYPNLYVYEYFCTAINKCINEGIEGFLIKKYVPAVTKFDARYEKMILDCMSSQSRFNQPQIHKKICKVCDEKGWEKPSLSWVKTTFRRLYAISYPGRNGADDFFYNQKPYMGLIPAQNANSQWQIDGWRLPFYMKDFETLTLFWVIDAHSNKVIGSYVDSSENTETIMKGLEDAVTQTKVLPYEIVSDNHTFNKTSEAEHLKAGLERFGVHWTVSMNPRRKSKVERSFRTFGDNFCKEENGYIGQGIKTKIKDGRPTQEKIDKSMKNPLTREQIILIAGRCIEEYNNMKGKDGKSPNERYQEAINDAKRVKKSFNVTELDISQLFIRRSKAKASKGQIIIERSGVKYAFEFNSKQFNKLNNKTFWVRYASFDEIHCI